MQFVQLADRIAIDTRHTEPIQTNAFPGTWVNSNPDTSGIARLHMSHSDGQLLLRVFAIGTEGLIDWGVESVSVFTASPKSRVGAGFTSLFDFGFAETRLQGMI